MSLGRREFMQLLALAAASGIALESRELLAAEPSAAERLYDLPTFGNLSFLHFTDCHAQLLPAWFREPSVNLGVGAAKGRPPHLVGEHLLEAFGVAPGTREAHAFTFLDFAAAARTYGKVGGFAHLATLVKRLRASRPQALLLDGGDTWQGSATSLWTEGKDMVDAALLLGVDMMTGHWEFTYGAKRVQQIVDHDLKGRIAFLAQNVKTADFGDAVFEPYSIRSMNGVPVAVIGQAFPYMPIANPRYFVPDWTFGIQEENLQKMVTEVRGKGAQAVVLLSHNGMDVDLKLASRVSGIDAILGGHTHDAVPQPTVVRNSGGQTLVTNAGCNGKFLGVLDLDVRAGRVQDFRYHLLPIFANLLPADRQMQAQIDGARAPYRERLAETLAVSEGLLYRRGNFNGTWDQLIVDAMLEVKGVEHRVLARFPLGHYDPRRRADHARADDGPARDHLSGHDRHRDDRRDDQDHPRRRRRQPVQPRPVLPAGRRHGSGRRPRIHLHAGGDGRRTHLGNALARRGARCRSQLQGRWLGTGRRRGSRRTDLGRGRDLVAQQEGRTAAPAVSSGAARRAGQPGTRGGLSRVP